MRALKKLLNFFDSNYLIFQNNSESIAILSPVKKMRARPLNLDCQRVPGAFVLARVPFDRAKTNACFDLTSSSG